MLATILGTFYHLRQRSALWGFTVKNLMETWFGDLFIEADEHRNKDGARELSLCPFKHYYRNDAEGWKYLLL